ncbi:MAG: type II secretion system F family protein [Ignavibacteria bacterium]|nr:type II secretion system F family protein [Ignavibacteria bacterium]
MPEFRFTGAVPSGKTVQGNVTATSASDARKKIAELSKGRPFKVSRLEKRCTYVYRVQKDNEKPIDGEQKAFSKEEVTSGLAGMGFKVLYVRKKFREATGKPPIGDVITFVRLSAELLREKLPFNEVLTLLSNDIDNRSLKEALRDINAELRQGKETERVFQKFEHIFGKFTSKMLGLASKSGAMAEMYDSTAKFLERNMEFRKAMKSAMMMPMITLVLLILAVVFYVAYIFPETARMFLKYGIELPPMTEKTLEMSDWLVGHIIWVILFIVSVTIGVVSVYTSHKGRLWFDKTLMQLPVMGPLIHKTNIEVFSRVFYSLYSGSGENIDVIKTAAEATGNLYFEEQIKTITIPMMLKHGKGLHESLEAANVFTRTALSRYHAGSETGMVKETALQLANFYERETTYRLKSVVDMMQLWVALIIMIVMTAITVVSSEVSIIKPKTPGMGALDMLPFLLPSLLPVQDILKKCKKWISRHRIPQN